MPRSTEAKNDRERRKTLRDHQKAMKENREYRETYERGQQIRKHEEHMQRLLKQKEDELRWIKESIDGIKNNQEKVSELQKEKTQTKEAIDKIQKDIENSTKELYQKQSILEKIISGKKSPDSSNKLSSISKNIIDWDIQTPKNMDAIEVIKWREYDHNYNSWTTPSLQEQLDKTETARGNIRAIQSLDEAERKILQKHAEAIHKDYKTVLKETKISSPSGYSDDIAWVRWDLAKQLGYAKEENNQKNKEKYPVWDPSQDPLDTTHKKSVIYRHLWREGRQAFDKENYPLDKFKEWRSGDELAEAIHLRELFTKDNKDIHTWELEELWEIIHDLGPP